MKKMISVLLALLLLAGLSCTAFAAQDGIQPGDAMPDFTVALCIALVSIRRGCAQNGYQHREHVHFINCYVV